MKRPKIPPPSLHTPLHIYIKLGGGVQAEIPIEPTISLSEGMRLESLKEVSANHLAPIADQLPDQAIESMKHLLLSIPAKVLGFAAKYLSEAARLIIEPLLLEFDIVLDGC